ncbi:hypothetical protein [Mucilaginibacter jinjuensis]|uniref:DUF4375 domain-containing protein n=1 Tax=Mucilaginibacter jinjuensis TaxID=1176721 RepID=A0ABY7T9F3_9SPHI|nr:hypothetical protein [Mucilaginibacter jinjuensis]WCT12933.1 hypothetical protein PQO05_03165 [Mucilaginibacter jinjuensis]
MEIIDNYSYVSDYTVDANFFKRFSTVKCKWRGSRYWKVLKDNSFTLVNDIAFFAFERESKEVFLRYEGKMLLNVVFGETENDVEEVFEQIKMHNTSMKDFIFNNSLTFYNELNEFMLNIKPDEQDYRLLRDEIEQLKSGKKYEELSEHELYHQENRPRFIVKL